MQKVKNKNSKKKLYIICVLILIAIATIVLILTQGKYKLDNNTFHTQNSEEFYFESNLLKLEDTTEYTYSDWDTTQDYSIKFDIQNYIDNLRINTLKTTYEVQVTVETTGVTAATYINGVESLTGEMEANSSISDEVEVKITPSDVQSIKLKIEVTSTAPYEKTLVANFNINPKNEISNYKANLIQETDADYAKLFIQTNSFSGKLKIAYNGQKVTPDMNYTILQNVQKVQIENGNYYYIEVELEANTNYQIDFIKKSTDVTLTNGDSIQDYDIVVGY